MWNPSLFSRTAIRRFIRLKSMPVELLLGLLSPDLVTNAWISASMGLVPSIQQETTVPETPVGLPDSMNSEGFGTCTRPVERISKTPISLVDPNLFLTLRSTRYDACLSPSKYRTVSTMCSRTLGPATVPSLVTCPTMNMDMFSVLAILSRILNIRILPFFS